MSRVNSNSAYSILVAIAFSLSLFGCSHAFFGSASTAETVAQVVTAPDLLKSEEHSASERYDSESEQLYIQRVYRADGSFDDSGLSAPICRAVLGEYKDRPLNHPQNLCTIVPRDGSKSFVRPDWRRLDGLEKIHLIGELSILRSWRDPIMADYRHSKSDYFNWPDGFNKYGEVSQPHKLPAAVLNEILIPLESEIKHLVSEGKIWIESAKFDLTNDGQIDSVVRLSSFPLKRSKKASQPFEIDYDALNKINEYASSRDCDDAVGALFIISGDDPNFTSAMLNWTEFSFDVLSYEDATYIANHQTIYRPVGGNDQKSSYHLEPICSFAWKFQVEERAANGTLSKWPTYPKIEESK